MIVDKFSLAKDAEYEVIWNGTSYTCTGVEYYLDSLLLICVGDLAVFEGIEPTDYPFLVARIADDATAEVVGAYGMVISYEGLTDVNLSINGTIIYQIDKKFVPTPDVVTNIVNGDNVGSVRNRYAQPNDDEYQIGEFATALGYLTKASGDYSHAEGESTTASGDYSHAECEGTTASGYSSHAEGDYTTASGYSSHAEGDYTTASGYSSHAEGVYTTASGDSSHAEGEYTTASSSHQHVQGKHNIKDTVNKYAHIVGNGTPIKPSNAHTLDWDGNAWFAGDVYVGSTSGTNKDTGSKKLVTEADLDNVAAGKADKTHTHVIADVSDLQSSLDAKVPTSRTINGKALTTNISLTASDVGALPDTTVIPSIDGLATEEYVNTQVSTKPGKFGTGSNAEIFNDLTSNQASGYASHAEGENTTASGRCSHAEGKLTTASGQDSHAEGRSTIASGMSAHAEGVVSVSSVNLTGEANATEYVCSGHDQSYCNVDSYFKVNDSIIFITNVSNNNNITKIIVSNTLSAEAITDKEYTVYRGIAKGTFSHTEGQNTTASNGGAHAEGIHTTASGYASHAEGHYTTATGQRSHAEGYNAIASGNFAHVEGTRTTASGTGSHAEGASTTASGYCSHAEGYYTTASGSYQHVQGKCNIEDTTDSYAHIVGNGTLGKPSNAHTLDWDGNAWFAGEVYVGSTSGKDKDAGSKKLVTEADLASLTASDVGALPDTTVIPSIAGLATEEYVDNSIETIPIITTAEIDEICKEQSFAYDESGNVSILSVFENSTLSYDDDGNVVINSEVN